MSKFFYNIADKNACFLINCKILVTRDIEKQTLLYGWLQTRHNRLVWKKILSVKLRKKIYLFIRKRSKKTKQKQR